MVHNIELILNKNARETARLQQAQLVAMEQRKLEEAGGSRKRPNVTSFWCSFIFLSFSYAIFNCSLNTMFFMITVLFKFWYCSHFFAQCKKNTHISTYLALQEHVKTNLKKTLVNLVFSRLFQCIRSCRFRFLRSMEQRAIRIVCRVHAKHLSHFQPDSFVQGHTQQSVYTWNSWIY